MKQLILAEKPSVGADIARALGVKPRSKEKGLIEGQSSSGQDLLITWCVGHLVELCEPHEYRPEWKRWSVQTLPLLPQEFKTRPRQSAQDQWRVVQHQLRRPDISEVINACDAGREGELIFRMVYELAQCRRPVRRLWISSLTPEAIRDGFRDLRPSSEFDDLAAAAAARNQADWLVGLNATRASTIMARGRSSEAPLFSVGRVQTPTLAMLEERDRAIETFVPEDYFELWAEFKQRAAAGDVIYRGRWKNEKNETRFKALDKAREVEMAVAGKPAVVEELEQKTVEEKAPLLFDLTSLQRTANSAFGFPASKTLQIAQDLYEKHKAITYPRTDSRFLTPDLEATLRGRIEAIEGGPWGEWATRLLEKKDLPSIARVFQPGKVKDHHAILPTPKMPPLDSLKPEERKIYEMIVRRFLGLFYPPARYADVVAITRVDTTQGPERFRSHGKSLLDPGWKAVAGFGDEPAKPAAKKGKKRTDSPEDEPEPDAGAEHLARLRQAEKVSVEQTGIDEKRTKPPSRYSDGSLLAAMEGAGKLIEDEELRQAMKEGGLGTPATRASIIETLLSRAYIERDGKSFKVTPAGRALISFLPVEALKSPELTGSWEARLTRMARGEERFSKFMEDIRSFVSEMTRRILSSQAPPRFENAIGACPRCGKPVLPGQRFYECQDAREGICKTRIPRLIAGKELTEKQVASLLTEGATQSISGFKSKKGSSFSAALRLTEEGVEFSFDDTSPKKSSGVQGPPAPGGPGRSPEKPSTPTPTPTLEKLGAACPQCKQGELIAGRRGWGCSRWREGCSFVLWFEIGGKKLTAKQAQTLVAKGKTTSLAGFKDSTGNPFKARVVLGYNLEGKLEAQILRE